jgi:hypothetical protein
MLAALAVLLAIGTSAATVQSQLTAVVIPVLTALTFLLAVVLAAVLIAPVVAVRSLRQGRVVAPATWSLAAVLVVGAVMVYGHFYTDRQWATVGSQVGLCSGVMPLAEVVQNRVAHDRYAPWNSIGGCND